MANYWSERQARRRLVTGEQLALETSVDVLRLYNLALRKINDDIADIYTNYSKKTGLDVSELSQILTGSEKKSFLLNIQKKMMELGFEIEDVYQPSYIARISRLQALKEKIYWEMIRLKVYEERVLTTKFAGAYVQAYDEIMSDYIGKQYLSGSFTSIHTGAIDEILRERWTGRNFSENVWGDPATDTWRRLARDIPEMVGSGLAIGRSYERTAREVAQSFDVSVGRAMTLVRTESAYFTGQAELQAMLDLGIEEYEYYAIMDGRTSQMCKDMDGEIFRYDEVEVGENYPPLHPNCRSRAMPIVDGEKLDRKRDIYIQEMSASDSVMVLNSDRISPLETESAEQYLALKLGVDKMAPRGEWNQSVKGNYAVVLDETDSRVTLSGIVAQVKGTGLGTEIMNNLKEYSDSTAKLLLVEDVQNRPFFKRFDWLEEKKSLDSFMYAPQDEAIRKMAALDTPLVNDKVSPDERIREINPKYADMVKRGYDNDYVVEPERDIKKGMEDLFTDKDMNTDLLLDTDKIRISKGIRTSDRVGYENYMLHTEGWYDDCLESRGLGKSSPEKVKELAEGIMVQERGIENGISGYIPNVKGTEYGVSYILEPIEKDIRIIAESPKPVVFGKTKVVNEEKDIVIKGIDDIKRYSINDAEEKILNMSENDMLRAGLIKFRENKVVGGEVVQYGDWYSFKDKQYYSNSDYSDSTSLGTASHKVKDQIREGWDMASLYKKDIPVASDLDILNRDLKVYRAGDFDKVADTNTTGLYFTSVKEYAQTYEWAKDKVKEYVIEGGSKIYYARDIDTLYAEIYGKALRSGMARGDHSRWIDQLRTREKKVAQVLRKKGYDILHIQKENYDNGFHDYGKFEGYNADSVVLLNSKVKIKKQ